jgi:hypothetical protein
MVMRFGVNFPELFLVIGFRQVLGADVAQQTAQNASQASERSARTDS